MLGELALGKLALTLALALSQQPTITLIFGPEQTETITVVEAEAEYARLSSQSTLTDAENRRLVALVISLGTRPAVLLVPGAPGSRERLDWEIRRGVRRPAQQAIP